MDPGKTLVDNIRLIFWLDILASIVSFDEVRTFFNDIAQAITGHLLGASMLFASATYLTEETSK